MKRPTRLLRLLAVLGILAGMLVVTAPAAVASPSPGGEEAVWDGESLPPLFGAVESDVAAFECGENGAVDESAAACDGAQEVYFAAVGNGEDFGLGAAQTSVTIQNIDYEDAYIFFFVGNGDGWDVTEYAYLAAGASKTFSADDLGIAEGDLVPVVAVGYNYIVYEDDVLVLDPTFLAGVAKQAVVGDLLPMTTEADSAVSGYNAVSGREVGYFDQLYFPIVQTNCGPGGCWDSVLRIANVGLDANAAVTVRFFPSDDGSGSLQTGFQLQALVDVGETWSITLSDWVPAGWVGSAHVFSDDAVTATVDRFKAGTNMWITNTASNAAAENFWQYPTGPSAMPFVLFAPDVRMDYNGWNTGINVANTVDDENNINIQFFGNNGNAPQTLSQRLEEHGMTYFYEPSDPSEDDCNQPAGQAPTCDFVGGAIVLSEYPVAVAVDGVKYYGNDSNVGHAFSYAATGNVYTDQALPLAQKGNPTSGVGATSGINFLNPNAEATFVQTWWINPSGFQADNFGPVIVWVPGYATGFVYTMFQHNLPNGFTGAALVTSELPIAATSANVDYQVQGDGTVIYNLYNPCGFFRQSGYPDDDPSCVYQAPVEPPVVNQPGLIVKTVSCPDCDDDAQTVVGATVNVTGVTDEGDDYFRSADTNVNGEVLFSVPAGTYTVEIVDVPGGYAIDPASAIDEDVYVGEGDTVYLDNTVLKAGSTKIIDTAVSGLLVCAYEYPEGQGGKPLPPIGDVEDCVRGVAEMPKDFVPGQGEVYDKLRDAEYDEELWTDTAAVDCKDFEYLDDAQLFLDDYFKWAASYYGIGYNPANDPYFPHAIDQDFNRQVDCDDPTLYPIPYVQPETNEEMAERLGALIVKETDEDGNASFDLPAGCYYFVISGAGYETAIEDAVCLAPGVIEVNEVNMGEAPGALAKIFIPPFCNSEDESGPVDFDEEGDIDLIDCERGDGGPNTLDWTNVSMFVGIATGDCADLEDADSEETVLEALEGCDELVYWGGADDQITGSIFNAPFLYLSLAPGDYTLCWYAAWEFDAWSGNYSVEQDWVENGLACETFTIVSEEVTWYVNYADDSLRGILDVELTRGNGNPMPDDILVLLFDQDGDLVDWTCSSYWSGNWAQFWYVPEGTYTVTATDSNSWNGILYGCGAGNAWETQSATFVYDVNTDYNKDGVINDWWWSGQPDTIIALSSVGP